LSVGEQELVGSCSHLATIAVQDGVLGLGWLPVYRN
jgi:hypothetical protein